MLGQRVPVGSALCPQDVATLQYRAPCLAVDCLTQALPVPPHAALILDVACGTGLVAAEVRPPQIPCPLFTHLLKIFLSPLAPELCLPHQTHCSQTFGLQFIVGPLPPLDAGTQLRDDRCEL